MSDSVTNEDRAFSAGVGLLEYIKQTRPSTEDMSSEEEKEALVDLVSDLFHLADMLDYPIDVLIGDALSIYNDEIKEESDEPEVEEGPG